MRDISQRQLELAEQSANGSYSLKQRQAMNTEANRLVDEYNRIAASTTFNGRDLLSGVQQITIQAGAGESATETWSGGDALSRIVGTGSFSAGVTLAGTSAITGDFNGDGGRGHCFYSIQPDADRLHFQP